MKFNLNESKVISIDFEGNGRNPPEIIEIGITHISGLKQITKHNSWLVKPLKKITWQASKIHGIKNKDVENSSSLDEIKNEIYNEINNSFLIAHNAHIEVGLLQRFFPDYVPLGVIDTLKLSKEFLGDKVSSNGLTSIIDYFNLDSSIKHLVITGAHRAEYDAIAAALIFLYFYKEDKDKVMALIKYKERKQLNLFDN